MPANPWTERGNMPHAFSWWPMEALTISTTPIASTKPMRKGRLEVKRLIKSSLDKVSHPFVALLETRVGLKVGNQST